jgi:hypothetical protein
MRRVNVHPWWCARGRVCGAHRRDGEHRSHPLRIEVGGWRLVATRIQTVGGRSRLELAAVLDLADRSQAQTSAVAAVREALADTTWGGQ